jgi:presenilin-like A22 family membrane protease
MKHPAKATIIILVLFIATQLLGLFIINHYINPANTLPLGLETPEMEAGISFLSLIIAFIFAVLIFFLLAKLKVEFVLKIWFLVVVIVALVVAFQSILAPLEYAFIISLIIAIPLGFLEIYRRNFMLHNITLLLVYAGISAVFVPILNVWTIMAFLVLLSVYDIWAVWKSDFMMKLADFQINKVKVFPGFFVPYGSKKVKQKIKKWKKTLTKEQLTKKKIKIEVALLGGGDIAFPLIAAGVMLKTLGLASALIVVLFSTLALSYLLFFGDKKKPYPAIPYLTAGILIAIGLSYLIL